MVLSHPLLRYLERTGRKVGDLAKSAGTSRQTIYRLMNGSQSPSMDMAARIKVATAGEVTADDFIPIEQITDCTCPPGSAEACRHGDCPRNQRSAA